MNVPNVTPETFSAFTAGLSATHQTTLSPSLTDPKTHGTIMDNGVVADFAYDPAAKSLDIEVKQRPFYLPVKSIEHALNDAITAAAKPPADEGKAPPPAPAEGKAPMPEHKAQSR